MQTLRSTEPHSQVTRVPVRVDGDWAAFVEAIIARTGHPPAGQRIVLWTSHHVSIGVRATPQMAAQYTFLASFCISA